MKTLLSIVAALALSSTLIAGNGAQNHSQQKSNLNNPVQQQITQVDIINAMEVYPLSYEQQATMEFMYQEEKMMSLWQGKILEIKRISSLNFSTLSMGTRLNQFYNSP